MFNVSSGIIWIQHRVLGLRMLSVGLHLAHFGSNNLSIIKPHMEKIYKEDVPVVAELRLGRLKFVPNNISL